MGDAIIIVQVPVLTFMVLGFLYENIGSYSMSSHTVDTKHSLLS